MRNVLFFLVLILTITQLWADDTETKVNSEVGFRFARGSWGNNVRSKPYLKSELQKKFNDDFSSPLLDISFRASENLTSKNQNEEVELRSLRLSKKGTHYAFDWGLQTVNWSETFGFNILDIVNPRDWSEFVFEDLSWAQIPVWALKNSFFYGNFKFQLIYVPRAKNLIAPRSGSYFDPLSKLTTLPRKNYSSKKIFKDDEWGMRLEYLFDFGLDLSLISYEHFNRTPVYSLKEGGLVPTDPKLKSYALSFTYALNSFVLRGDTLQTSNQPYNSSDLLNHTKNDWQGIYGLDYTFENQLMIGGQYEFEQISKNKWGSIQLKKSIKDFDLQCLFFFGLNNDDRWVRPELTWHLPYAMTIRAYSDFIRGKSGGVLSPFDRKKLYAMNFNWMF